MRVVIERHGGTIENCVGDALMVVFGTATAANAPPHSPASSGASGTNEQPAAACADLGATLGAAASATAKTARAMAGPDHR
jgi:class 3 adenylate cyclase